MTWDVNAPDYWLPRPCLRSPIAAIFDAADDLSIAADAYLDGDHRRAAALIKRSDNPAIRDWIESLWGSRIRYPEKVHYLRIRGVAERAATLPIGKRRKARAPTPETARKLIERFGWNCAYCGIPLIDRGARRLLLAAYPNVLRWGVDNDSKHTAFMCMDNEFDHVVPHSRGGTNDCDNLVPCCAPCNCGKENWTLEQLGLIDPRTKSLTRSDWDGLTRLLSKERSS